MRRSLLLLTCLWTACSGDDRDCPVGFMPGEGNLCLQEADDSPNEPVQATMEGLIEGLPACAAPATGDGLMDLGAGCVRGACAGGTMASFEDALGPGRCDVITYSFDGGEFEFASCDFDHGLSGSFDAIEGVPDRSSTTFALYVDLPNEDTTTDGFGLGAEFRCLVERLGMPTRSSWSRVGDDWRPSSMSWPALAAGDYVDNQIGLQGADGRIDSLSLYNF